MRLPASVRLALPWLGTLIAFLAIGIVVPSETHAGCSTPEVTSSSPRFHALIGLEALSRDGRFVIPAEKKPVERPKRCSGAFCSREASPASSTAVSVFESGGGQWGISSILPVVYRPESLRFREAEADVLPVNRSRPIPHPPPFRADSFTS